MHCPNCDENLTIAILTNRVGKIISTVYDCVFCGHHETR